MSDLYRGPPDVKAVTLINQALYRAALKRPDESRIRSMNVLLLRHYIHAGLCQDKARAWQTIANIEQQDQCLDLD